MSITRLADRLISAVVPTTDASASCGRYEFVYYRCCAAAFKHKALYQDVCGNTQWGSSVNSYPECG